MNRSQSLDSSGLFSLLFVTTFLMPLAEPGSRTKKKRHNHNLAVPFSQIRRSETRARDGDEGMSAEAIDLLFHFL